MKLIHCEGITYYDDDMIDTKNINKEKIVRTILYKSVILEFDLI